MMLIKRSYQKLGHPFLRDFFVTLIFEQRSAFRIYSGRSTGSLGIAVPPSVSPIYTQLLCDLLNQSMHISVLK